MGVFPSVSVLSLYISSLPHARGGVSASVESVESSSWSSPRPWGCFRRAERMINLYAVFPTPVGVFLLINAQKVLVFCLPHARGGVSRLHKWREATIGSSPRPWGCFPHLLRTLHTHLVFPTPVGVFLTAYRFVDADISLPHARGGVSI